MRQRNIVDIYLVRLKSDMVPGEKVEVYSREEEEEEEEVENGVGEGVEEEDNLNYEVK